MAATLAATAARDRRRIGGGDRRPAHQGVDASCSAGGGSSSLIALQRRTAVPRVQGRTAAGAGIWSWVMGDPADEEYQWCDRIDLNQPGVPGRGPRRTGPRGAAGTPVHT